MKAQLFNNAKGGCTLVVEGHGNIPFGFVPEVIQAGGVAPFKEALGMFDVDNSPEFAPIGEPVMEFEV